MQYREIVMRLSEVEEIIPRNISYYRLSYRIDAKIRGKRVYLAIPAHDIDKRIAERRLIKIMKDKIDFILDNEAKNKNTRKRGK